MQNAVPEAVGVPKPAVGVPKGATPKPPAAGAGVAAAAAAGEEEVGFPKLRPLPKGEGAAPDAVCPEEEDWQDPTATQVQRG